MGQYNSVVITSAGFNMLTQAEAGNKKITLTQMKTSESAYSGGSFVAKQEVNINGINIVDNIYTFRAAFSNESIVADYEIKAVGMFARLENEEPILFCYSNASVADIMPRYNGVSPISIEYEFESGITQSDSINVTVNPQGLATIEYVENRLKDYVVVTIPIDNWVENTDTDNNKYYTREINVSGMTADYVGGTSKVDYVRPNPFNITANETALEMYQLILDIESMAGKIKVTASEIPTSAFQIYLYGVLTI